MGKSQRHRNWAAQLAPVQGTPSLPERTVVQSSEIVELKRKPQRQGQGVATIGNVRVSFPVRFGIGSGVGGVDSGGLVLRLARVEGGCGITNDHDTDNVVRYSRYNHL